MSIIYSLFVFLIVILVHEFGHFIVAKLNNIRVNEFSIGMGPKLLSKQGEETFYTLRALPIGGYVALEGEDDESDDPRSFNRAHPLKRIAVLFAGAFHTVHAISLEKKPGACGRTGGVLSIQG